MSGKMKYIVDGLNYCEDDNIPKKNANMDCSYDVRLMYNHGDILVFFALTFTNRVFIHYLKHIPFENLLIFNICYLYIQRFNYGINRI